jgi:hypothetical protein
LLAQAGSATPQAQQLELDMRGTLTGTMRTGPEKKVNIARMTELMAQNKSLRVDPLSLWCMSIYPALFALFGMHPKLWDAGKIATADTATEGFLVHIYKSFPLFAKAAVGRCAQGVYPDSIRAGLFRYIHDVSLDRPDGRDAPAAS